MEYILSHWQTILLIAGGISAIVVFWGKLVDAILKTKELTAKAGKPNEYPNQNIESKIIVESNLADHSQFSTELLTLKYIVESKGGRSGIPPLLAKTSLPQRNLEKILNSLENSGFTRREHTSHGLRIYATSNGFAKIRETLLATTS